MTATTDMLDRAYQRIHEDLGRVGEIILRELHGDRPEMDALCAHLACFRGKMLRPALVLLTARATGAIRPIHLNLAAVIEMFHLASLVHDDVLDEAAVRRQVGTINSGWGNESAVILGDWLISHAYHLCSRQNSQWANMEISTVAHSVCQGELAQLSRCGRLDLSTEEYLSIIAEKTASLIGLAARLGAHFNDAPDTVELACLEYGRLLGMAFQISDDILDLVGDETEAGKTLGSDLAKGKATLPLIHFLASAEPAQADRVRTLLDGHPAARSDAGASAGYQPDREALALARKMIIEFGAARSAEAVARQYVESAKQCVAEVFQGPVRADMELLADFVLARGG